MKQRIIGLVGPKGSGKGTLAKYLQNQYGAQIVTFSDVLNDILRTLNLEQTRVNQIYLSIALREQFGYDILAQALTHRIAQLKSHPLIVVDGIRFLQDLKPWRQSTNFTLISLDADIKLRFDRLKKRGLTAEEKKLTWQKFSKEETMPTEISFKKIARQAHYYIDTNTALENTYRELDNIAQKIKIKKVTVN